MADLLDDLKAKVLEINPALTVAQVEDNALALMTIYTNAGSKQTFTSIVDGAPIVMQAMLNSLKQDGHRIEDYYSAQNGAQPNNFTGIIVSSKS